MALKIYNTLSREKEDFQPLNPPHVGMYFCGPTVYGDSHVGHAKAYITADIVHRYLEFLGYHVTYVQNITDVGHMTDNDDVSGEDKLDVQSRKEKKHPMEVAEFYTRRYYEDMDALNILRPDIAPRATGHIIEQIEMIKGLIAKGFAYEVDGNVYFDVSKDKEYGKLSGRKVEDQEASGRVQARSDKRSPNDFALWKRAEKGHILHWPSPWGDGFPGWHIECSAMSMKYLGETFDIHGAGLENSFPHNECEIAQSESANGKPFVRYWMHNNMVTTGGVKMGKSLGNSAYLRDLTRPHNPKGHDPFALRFALLLSHYRSTTEFTEEALQAAEAAYRKLLETYKRLAAAIREPARRSLTTAERGQALVAAFETALDNDFNTPQAIAHLQSLSKDTNTMLDAPREQRNEQILERLYQVWWVLAGDILGLLPSHQALISESNKTYELMSFVMRLRQRARDMRDFADSDAIRIEMDKIGIALDDSKDGMTWRVK